MKKAIAFFLFFVFAFFGTFAQKTQEEKLGIQYFQNGEYEKAAPMFEKVYNANPNSYIYYYYYQTLLQLGDFKGAEKIVKKQQKNSPKTQRYKTDLGFIYESAGEQEKADKVYNDAIKELPAQENVVKELYNAFLARKQYQYAVTTLERGRKLLNNSELFSYELTNVYTQMNRTDLVVEEALNMVKNNSQGKLTQVQQILQNLLAGDENKQRYNTVLATTMRRSQEAPDNHCYAMVLQWLYQADKNYPDALLIAKSLDRKQKEGGQRVFALAKDATANKDFATAKEACNYIIKLGEDADFYTKAKFYLLDIQYDEISESSPIDKTAALALENEFASVLQEYGMHEGTSEWIQKYAHLLAFYVDKPEKATQVLEGAIAQASRNPQEKALYKVDLADIELYTGNVWDATLHYSQVDKDLPNDVIGQTAKFKNAKLSFYIGEFAWAKSQLDVLRAATSKLIANDAMYFSFLISDNEEEAEDAEDEEDGELFTADANSNLPLRYYAKADFLIFQNKDDEALKMLDSIIMVDPTGKLTDDVYYQKAKIAIKQKDFLGAEQLLQKVVTTYSMDLLGDDATYLLGQLYDYYIKDNSKAMEYYQKVLTDFPDSLYTIDARKRYRELRGDNY